MQKKQHLTSIIDQKYRAWRDDLRALYFCCDPVAGYGRVSAFFKVQGCQKDWLAYIVASADAV